MARVSNDVAVARLRGYLDAFHVARDPARVRALCGDLLNALTELLPGAAKAGLKIAQAIDRYASNVSQGPSEIVEALQTAIEEPTREWMANEFEQVKSILDQTLVMLARLQPSSDVQRLAVLFEGPRQVPAKAVPFFRGRDNELAELERLLLDNRTVCVTATGIGGIGKTTLAEEFVATRAPELFPDGVAWLDGRELITELGRVARRFGWGDKREATPPEVLSLLGQQLHTQRFLLVIDSFDPTMGEPEHVPNPGGQCRTLVTSRSRPLAGRLAAAQLELGLWDLEACREYLRERCPRLRTEADAEVDGLAEFVGRLPLALRLLVSVLNNRRSLGPAGVLKLLEQQPLGLLDKYEANRGIAATFQVSYEALTDVGRRVLLALNVCAKQTRTEVVGSVAKVHDADEVLDDLHARGLAEFAEEGDTAAPWGLHDVVRMFVAEQRGREEFEAAHEEFVHKYIADHKAPIAHEEFSKGVTEAWVAFQRLVARDPARSISVYRPLEYHLTLTGRYPEAIKLSESLIAATPESELATIAMNSLGNCYRVLGDIPKAIELHRRSLDISKRIGRLVGEAAALLNLGNCCQALGDIAPAINYYGEARAIQVRLGDLEGQAASLGNLGVCYCALGHIPQAIELLEQAFAIEREHGNLLGQAIALGALGSCYLTLDDIPKAIDLHEQALRIEEMINYLPGQAGSLGGLGCCHQKSGNSSQAIEFHKRSLAIDEQLNNLSGQFNSLSNLGACYVALRDFRTAMRLIARALDVSGKLRRVADQATALGHLGACFVELGNIPKSIEAFKLALALEMQLGRLEGQAIQLCNLGRIIARHGPHALARDYFAQALDRYQRMGLAATNQDVQMVMNALAKLN